MINVEHNEYSRMITAWNEAHRNGRQVALATIVGIRGSSYRKLGAQMLLTEDGKRVGSVSGGCLEADIFRKVFWWLADHGFYLKTYDTESAEDDFALGCGGVIDILLERLRDDDENPLTVARQVRESRRVAVVSTSLSDPSLGRRRVLWNDKNKVQSFSKTMLDQRLELAAVQRRSTVVKVGKERIFLHAIEPPVHLVVCGAGHDAQPLVRFASSLGWTVSVLDQRSDFARAQRFPEADHVLPIRRAEDLTSACFDERTAAVVMTHSFAQDRFFLEQLAQHSLRYVGLLGARARTLSLLAEAAACPSAEALHAPAGLNLGAETPEEIALSIVAEIAASFHDRDGGSLRNSRPPLHAVSI